jgi:hypothetical protein
MSPKGQTPPRSPSGEKFMGRTLSPKQTALLLEPKPTLSSDDLINPSSYGSPRSKNSQGGYMDKFAKTDANEMAKLVKQKALEK